MLFDPSPSILLVGGGNMGQALAEGWLRAGLIPPQLTIIDRHPERFEQSELLNQVCVVRSLDSLNTNPIDCDAVIIAVKPQASSIALEGLSKLSFSTPPLIVSVMAGLSLTQVSDGLWPQARVARLMPNTPSSIGLGIGAACANAHIGEKDKELIVQLAQAIGEYIWLDDEHQMHAFTALAGSGPAYVFHLIDVFQQIAIEQGFEAQQAMLIARQVFYGASALLAQSNLTPEALITKVASPGGTTAAGLEEIQKSAMKTILNRTINAAKERSKQMC